MQFSMQVFSAAGSPDGESTKNSIYIYTDLEGFKWFKALWVKPKGFNSFKPNREVYNYFKP